MGFKWQMAFQGLVKDHYLAADVYTYDYKESSKTISQNPQVYDLHGILPYPNPPQNK